MSVKFWTASQATGFVLPLFILYLFFYAVDGRSLRASILSCSWQTIVYPFMWPMKCNLVRRVTCSLLLLRTSLHPVTPKIRFTLWKGFKTFCPQKQLALPPLPLSRRQGHRFGRGLGQRPGRRPIHLYTIVLEIYSIYFWNGGGSFHFPITHMCHFQHSLILLLTNRDWGPKTLDIFCHQEAQHNNKIAWNRGDPSRFYSN